MTNYNDLINALLRRRIDGTSTEEIMASAASALRIQQQVIERLKGERDKAIDALTNYDQARTLVKSAITERDILRAEVVGLKEQYIDLITQVACKFPGETRHDTAKRYIAERETREVAGPSQEATAERTHP